MEIFSKQPETFEKSFLSFFKLLIHGVSFCFELRHFDRFFRYQSMTERVLEEHYYGEDFFMS